jgi:ribulose bisphosphate carboxylase small subunit
MGFIVVEEWGDKDNPFRYLWIQVSAKGFKTREEANKEVEKHKPTHDDGYIRVRKDPADNPAPKRRGRKKPNHRNAKRRDRR